MKNLFLYPQYKTQLKDWVVQSNDPLAEFLR